MKNFEDTIAAALKHCPKGVVCLAAVSGGADSTAMLTALAALRERQAVFQLYCIHIEHGIRPPEESRGDAAYVRLLCEKLNVPCRVVSIAPGKIAALAKDRGMGIEAAARQYRRRAWFREARHIESDDGNPGPVRILTAHTADDMLENILMRILRGAGPSGLAAMPVSRGRILRPLLSLRRSDVEQYLTEKNIPWREDATNTDIRYFRNRVRHRLIPLLNEFFPHWRAALGSFARTQSLSAAGIRSEARQGVVWETLPSGALAADAEHFFARPAIVREEALFQGINRLLSGVSRPPREIRRINIRLFSNGDVNSLDMGLLYLRRENGRILLSLKRNDVFECGFSLLIKEPGSYNLTGVCSENMAGEPDGFTTLLPLVLRPCFKDDYIENRGSKIRPPDLSSSGRIITAVDSLGPAAFIGSAGVLLRRDDSTVPEFNTLHGSKHYAVVNGGIHVQ